MEANATAVTVVVAPTRDEAQQITFDAETWRRIAGEPSEDAGGFIELGRYEGGERVVRLIADDGEGQRLDVEDAELYDRVTTWSR